jgi:hypothetical protein
LVNNLFQPREFRRRDPFDPAFRCLPQIAEIGALQPTALILARVFGNGPDFWLNVQRRSDLWEAMNSPRERERIERATPLGTAA